jgi:hypothetical protein
LIHNKVEAFFHPAGLQPCSASGADEETPDQIGPAAMPQPNPFRNSHAPAEAGEETEFPRFKKPVGALAEAAFQEEKPMVAGAETGRRRSAKFLFGFMAGVLAAGIGVAVVFLMLIRGDLDSINPAQQPQRRETKVVAPEILGAPLPLESPAPAAPPEASRETAPPPVPALPPAPSALNQARLFVHHSATPSQAAVATDIAGRLRGGGLSVIDIRRIQGTVSAGSVRFFFPEDRKAAAGLAEMLSQFYRGRNVPREFRLLDFTHYNPKPRERTLEIWLPD